MHILLNTSLFFTLFIVSVLSANIYNKNNISDKWKVKIYDCPESSPHSSPQFQLQTSIPTNVHLDLLYNKKILDPYLSTNWQKIVWVSYCKSRYTKKLLISQQILKFQVINLVFEGIDTYSQIKLNSKIILTTQNAFIEYKVNIRESVHVGENELQIEIKPTQIYDNQGQSKNMMPHQFAQSRKPRIQYSTDFSPYMNTQGIWKDAYLQFYDALSIDYVWIQLERLEQIQAQLNFAVKLKGKDNKWLNQQQKEQYRIQIRHNQSQLNKFQVYNTELSLKVKIKNPRLWWPNNIGQPYIYNFEIRLLTKGNVIINFKNITYGIRTVRLDQSDESFALILNGYKVYCKGASYVPLDLLYPRLQNRNYQPSYNKQKLLTDVIQSNFNMIKIWGGGVYESNQFYQMACKLGIMIFHDFMFADTIYPTNKEFLDNTKVEIIQQIRRLRNYPCIVLFSGNNMVFKNINLKSWNSLEYKDNYHKFFQEHIPKIVESQSSNIPYIHSFPLINDRIDSITHQKLWDEMLPFQTHQNFIGNFNTQFGTQSFPVIQTIVQFAQQSDLSYDSNVLLTHEKHGSQFHIIRQYIDKYGKPALNFQLQVYQSGLIQAYCIQIAVIAQRISKSIKSMGSLFWQLNDAWPSVSWSSIDYYGRWKPLQYKVKKLYENIIAAYDHKSGKVIAINDNLYNISCYVITKIISFKGEVLKDYNNSITLRQNQVKQILQLEKEDMDKNSSKVLIYNKIVLGKENMIGFATFLSPYKNLQLERCRLNVRFQFGIKKILLAAKCLIKSVHIYHAGKYLQLSDNYIDIIPGQIHEVTYLGPNLLMISKQLKFRSYLQVYDPKDLQIKVY